MIKFTFELEEVKGSFTEAGNGRYLLSVEDDEGNKDSKEVSIEEMAAILYSVNDPDQSMDPIRTAYECLKDFKVQVLP